MVRGIELFREHFSDHQDQYVLIGGTASSLAMEELGADFRATKDLDIVLCVEALNENLNEEFDSAIWAAKFSEHTEDFVDIRLRQLPGEWDVGHYLKHTVIQLQHG